MSIKGRKPVASAPPPPARATSKFGRFAAQRGEAVRRNERVIIRAAMVIAGVAVVWVVLASLFGERSPQVQPLVLPAVTQAGQAAAATPRPPILVTGVGTRPSESFLLQSGPVKFTMKHEGKAAFTVRLEDSQGNPAGGAAGLGSELTNSVGAFIGEKSTTISGPGSYRLHVTADGPWQILIQP